MTSLNISLNGKGALLDASMQTLLVAQGLPARQP
jgi:hypothetical protein